MSSEANLNDLSEQPVSKTPKTPTYTLKNIDEHPYLKNRDHLHRLLEQALQTGNPQEFKIKSNDLALKLMETNNFNEIYFHIDERAKQVELHTVKKTGLDPSIMLSQRKVGGRLMVYNFMNTLGKVRLQAEHNLQKGSKKIIAHYTKEDDYGTLGLGYRFKYKKPINKEFFYNGHYLCCGYKLKNYPLYISVESVNRRGQSYEEPIKDPIENSDSLKRSDLWNFRVYHNYQIASWIHMGSSVKVGLDESNKSQHVKMKVELVSSLYGNRTWSLESNTAVAACFGRNILPFDYLNRNNQARMGQHCKALIRQKFQLRFWNFPFLSSLAITPHQYAYAIASQGIDNKIRYEGETGIGFQLLRSQHPMFVEFPLLRFSKEPGIRIKLSF